MRMNDLAELRRARPGRAWPGRAGGWIMVLVGMLVSAPVWSAEPGLTPQQMVRETSDAVLDLIEEAQGYAEEDPERFYREVEAILAPAVDFDSFARSVMAVHYRDATPEQRQRFAESFKWGLVRTYALALTEFHDGEVVVVPPDRPPRNPARQTVKMEIRTRSGEVYPVLYSVTQEDDGSWRVQNLIVNGVNMGLTYRNQFNGAMSDPKYGGDLDRVIDGWAEMLRSEAPGLEESDDGVAGGGQSAADGAAAGSRHATERRWS